MSSFLHKTRGLRDLDSSLKPDIPATGPYQYPETTAWHTPLLSFDVPNRKILLTDTEAHGSRLASFKRQLGKPAQLLRGLSRGGLGVGKVELRNLSTCNIATVGDGSSNGRDLVEEVFWATGDDVTSDGSRSSG